MRLLEGTIFDRPPHCERCGKLESECACPPIEKPRVPPERQTAKLAVEKRQKGKWMTVIRGLTSADNDLAQLLSRLKTVCGAGGTVRDETIEIQGKQMDTIRAELQRIGYKTKV
jgi:translation initiation factor 1